MIAIMTITASPKRNVMPNMRHLLPYVKRFDSRNASRADNSLSTKSTIAKSQAIAITMPGIIPNAKPALIPPLMRAKRIKNSPMFLRYLASKMNSGLITLPLASSAARDEKAIVVPTFRYGIQIVRMYRIVVRSRLRKLIIPIAIPSLMVAMMLSFFIQLKF